MRVPWPPRIIPVILTIPQTTVHSLQISSLLTSTTPSIPHQVTMYPVRVPSLVCGDLADSPPNYNISLTDILADPCYLRNIFPIPHSITTHPQQISSLLISVTPPIPRQVTMYSSQSSSSFVVTSPRPYQSRGISLADILAGLRCPWSLVGLPPSRNVSPRVHLHCALLALHPCQSSTKSQCISCKHLRCPTKYNVLLQNTRAYYSNDPGTHRSQYTLRRYLHYPN